MKIQLYCPTCTENKLDPPLSIREKWAPTVVPLQNSSVYKFICGQGHSATVIMPNPKFELLFESGILALKDGYSREAVTSFAASLERFYEFMILVFAIKEAKVSKPEFDKVWKALSNSSEQQLGAVNFLYFKELGKLMLNFSKLVKDDKINLGGRDPINFRNIVTHQGYIPSYEHAVNYGEAVNLYIIKTIRYLSIARPELLKEAVVYIMENNIDESGMDAPVLAIRSYFISTKRTMASVTHPHLTPVQDEPLAEYIKR